MDEDDPREQLRRFGARGLRAARDQAQAALAEHPDCKPGSLCDRCRLATLILSAADGLLRVLFEDGPAWSTQKIARWPDHVASVRQDCERLRNFHFEVGQEAGPAAKHAKSQAAREEARKLIKQGKSREDVCKELGIKPSTLATYLKDPRPTKGVCPAPCEAPFKIGKSGPIPVKCPKCRAADKQASRALRDK